MDLTQAKRAYIIEAQELLETMERALLALESTEETGEAVNAIFRAVHTIKGSAGLFGFDAIVRFAHTVESVLDRVRSRQLDLSKALTEVLLGCHDHLALLVEAVQKEGELPAELYQQGAGLLAALVPYLEELPPPRHDLVAAIPEKGGDTREDEGPDTWHISVRFNPDVLRNGMDPLSFVRYLTTLGRMVHVHAVLEHLPRGTAFDPESCYLGLEMDLDTQASRQTLEDVFEFVREDSRVRLVPPHAKVEDYLRLIREMPENGNYVGQILVASGCLTAKELENALNTQKEEALEEGLLQRRMIGSILVEDHGVPAPAVAAALTKQKRQQDRGGQDLKVVKVHAEKLDRLVDLVGELVIAGAAANVMATASRDGRLIEATTNLTQLVEAIRDNALSLRMVQIGETFNRFRRIVRDVAQELGKNVELEIRGADTELDKSIVEKLNDPLMHIVRNALDHGIEPIEVRRARGKPDAGSLALNAFHESGSIIIEVMDDGGGLNRDRILQKAKQRGLVAEGAHLTDGEITNLIFEPGFSTADAVTNLSGRGVGMDVVRKNIDELRGSIEVESYEGSGTTFRIRLPLTLAIIDGFRVGVGDGSYVVPLDMVLECLDLGPFLESEEHHLVNLRGEVLPFLRLRELFGFTCSHPVREQVVVVQYGETRAGLVVDHLMGELQTVIKPLGDLFRHLKGIGGSTILGSGEVALILDVPQLVQLASEHMHAQRRRQAALSTSF